MKRVDENSYTHVSIHILSIYIYKGVLKHIVSRSFSRSGGVSLAVRGCGLKRFLPPIILCVYMWTCLCIVRSSFKMHIHTLVHTCILPKLTQPGCHTPNHDYKLKCEELFLVLLFIHVHCFFFLGFHKMMEHRSTFCPATNRDFTHCREVLLCKKGDLNKHKLNQEFVPNCFMFSI